MATIFKKKGHIVFKISSKIADDTEANASK